MTRYTKNIEDVMIFLEERLGRENIYFVTSNGVFTRDRLGNDKFIRLINKFDFYNLNDLEKFTNFKKVQKIIDKRQLYVNVSNVVRAHPDFPDCFGKGRLYYA